MIGIIGAMGIEVEDLINSMDLIKKETISGIDFFEGKLQNKNAVLAICGIGKVHAAVCTQTMILKYAPDAIINIGVAGCLSPELDFADIVISDSVVQHDFDVTPFGVPVGLISGIDLIKIPCSDRLVKKLVKAAEILEDTNIAVGTVASGDQFVGSKEKKDYIVNNFDALCTEMEGAAIGHVCYMNNVDFCIVRAMSDKADSTANMDFDIFVKNAIDKTIKLINRFLKVY
ncbi:MAG TPA: 5'-methylthioadenosine/adenosylhomocysteine nucleosidase [Sedimentibacter sp.]|nr:5'-methylthioadenosine/adenosylhomocysteine nucleosidase [Sedimentibacter sp.]HOH69527.1 5'-methylthioadenosine/adenosylhomocysteine nucleosidase [Sedimentibacter sp.]